MESVVITGASSGIGKEIAYTFSKKGWKTILVARNTERLKRVSENLDGPSQIVQCDLSKGDQIDSLKSQMTDWGNVTALVNNAGVYIPASVDKDSDQVWQDHFDTNLMSAIRMTRLLWPQFKAQEKGSIVNISSTLSTRPIPNTAAYSALKAAMNNWTLSLALEGAPFNVRANCVCPGLIDTPIHGFHQNEDPSMVELKSELQSIQPMGRMGQPEDVAPMVYQLSSNESSWTTGTIINIDGGILLKS